MAEDDQGNGALAGLIAQLVQAQADAARSLLVALTDAGASEGEKAAWARSTGELRDLWCDYLEGLLSDADELGNLHTRLGRIIALLGQLPEGLTDNLQKSFELGADLGPVDSSNGDADETFAGASPERDLLAALEQFYRGFVERLLAAVDGLDQLSPRQRQHLRALSGLVADALSPGPYAAITPQVLQRAIETRGNSLVRGAANLIADLRRGVLTHADPRPFRLGETIACTPGKVVHRTRLYELIQYTPATKQVMATPLVIFPAWINRFYILDLGPEKSLVRWLVEQAFTVFVVSWKSADETIADVLWDDYIAAQLEVVDQVRERLGVASVHAVGYCVAGTTLAATLAVAARRGEAERFCTATFLTTQVDFAEPGVLGMLVSDATIDAVPMLAEGGVVDGRYLSWMFNFLRPQALFWTPVLRHYLLGEDRPPYDLLHWNSDFTNLPARWHENFLRDLYRDNRLVDPDSLSALGTPIDLACIRTPSYVQAGRKDHLAPPASVWKLTRHLAGPWTFVLAGSGHIASVVNPPAAGKYGFLTHAEQPDSFDEYLTGAREREGSWWPHWAEWLRSHGAGLVAVDAKRDPPSGSPDAPGNYARMR